MTMTNPVNLEHVEFKSATGSSAKLTATLPAGRQFWIKGNADFFYQVGATGVTSAADTAGNTRCTAGVLYPIANITDAPGTSTNGFVAIINDGVTADVDLFKEVAGRLS